MQTTSQPFHPKTIWILWLQGWDHAPWLQKQVAESWKLHNPNWNIVLLDEKTLKNYVQDIDYIYDPQKQITVQAKSDIIRLSLLKNHGGIWADSTMLCMQPLDSWVHDKIQYAGLWMYHGTGGNLTNALNKPNGPASWFIVSEKDGYLIHQWKDSCDAYWKSHNSTDNYFWMDSLFAELYRNDSKFQELWDKIPYLFCNDDGQSHTLEIHGMENDTPHIKKIFQENPPFVLKLNNRWNQLFPDVTTDKCIRSNGYFAIQKALKSDSVV